MDEQKRNSIKTVGIFISIISCFIILSNSMGIFVWKIIGISENFNLNQDTSSIPIFLILKYFFSFGLLMVCLGILYLIGGVNIRKYRLWANKLVTFLSGIFIVIMWSLMIIFAFSLLHNNGMNVFLLFPVVTAAIWSAPFVTCIWYLNKHDIKSCFS